jgi:hypothetical protein
MPIYGERYRTTPYELHFGAVFYIGNDGNVALQIKVGKHHFEIGWRPTRIQPQEWADRYIPPPESPFLEIRGGRRFGKWIEYERRLR